MAISDEINHCSNPILLQVQGPQFHVSIEEPIRALVFCVSRLLENNSNSRHSSIPSLFKGIDSRADKRASEKTKKG
jgi:hypothetical protein